MLSITRLSTRGVCGLIIALLGGVGADGASLSFFSQREPGVPVVTFEFQGGVFESQSRTAGNLLKIERDTSAGMADAVLTAFGTQNEEFYAKVFEVQPEANGYHGTSRNKVSKGRFFSEVWYGSNVFILVELHAPIGVWIQPVALLKRSDGFHVVSAPIGDKAVELLYSYLGFGWDTNVIVKGGGVAANTQSTWFVTNVVSGYPKFPLKIGFSGVRHDMPILVGGHSSPNEDIYFSPDSVVGWAGFHEMRGNLDGYVNLIASDELASKTDGVSTELYVRSRFSRASAALTERILLTRTINCSDWTIVFYRSEHSKGDSAGWWIATRKIGGRFFLDSLNSQHGDASFCFPILGFFGFPMTAYPNLFLYGKE